MGHTVCPSWHGEEVTVYFFVKIELLVVQRSVQEVDEGQTGGVN